jgi:signal transduction histidine kinase
VSETRTREGAQDEAAEACRQVAQILGFRSVETVSESSAPVQDVLDGRVDGLIVFRVDEGSPVDLKGEPGELGRSARSAVANVAEQSPASSVTPAPSARTDTPLVRTLDAVRATLSGDGDLPRTLAAVRGAIGARELLFLRELDGRIHVAASPALDQPELLSDDDGSHLAGIARHLPIDDATIRRVASALGMRCAHASAAFGAHGGALELLIAGWDETRPLQRTDLAAVARIVATATELHEARTHAVHRLLWDERLRWAGEIHDGLTQAVTGAYLELRTLRGRIERDPGSAIASLDDVMRDVRTSVTQVRALLFDLADDSDSREADPVADYVAGVAERWQLPVNAEIQGDATIMPPSVRAAANIVIREAIANAAKHAEAAKVSLRLRRGSDEILLEIEDDGRGFDPRAAVERPGHFGLRLLQERVAASGGSVAIESEPGKGTVITARLPLRAEQGEMG